MNYLSIVFLAGILCLHSCNSRTTQSSEEREEPSTSRDLGLTVHSNNEPKSDADALALVGVSMQPVPEVVFLNFQGGMDDYMELVIRFPKDQLDTFWEHSKWDKQAAIALKELDPDALAHEIKWIQKIGRGDVKDPVVEALRKSTQGIRCSEQKWHNGGLSVYLALDQDADDVIAYIWWNEV